MTDELRQDFTRRLSQCNQGGMIVIIYDIYFAYMDDARAGYKNKDTELFKAGVRKAGQTIDELINALNMSYDIAKQLLPLYKYCKIQLSKALYEDKAERLDEADQIMKRLYDSFVEAADRTLQSRLWKIHSRYMRELHTAKMIWLKIV